MAQIKLLLAVAVFLCSCNHQNMDYPETKKVNAVDYYFGNKVKDPYRWLEDEDDPGVKEWISQQNMLTFSYLEKIPYRQKIKQRIEQLWNYPKKSAPFFEGGFYFFFKNNGLQNQDVLYFQKSLDAKPKLLLDPNKLSPDGTIALTNISVSRDGKYLAYSLSESGSDWNEIQVINIKTGKVLEDKIKWVKFSNISWSKDGFFYSRYDEPSGNTELSRQNLNHKVYYHEINTSQEEDLMIFANKENPKRFYRASTTHDEKYLLVSEMESTSGNNLYILNLKTDNPFLLQLTRGFKFDYEPVDNIGDNLYVLTNYNAPNYKLVKININTLQIGEWVDVLPEKEMRLVDCKISKGKIIAHYLKDAKSILQIHDANGLYEHEIDINTGTVYDINAHENTNDLFFSFTSFSTPSAVYRFNFTSKELSLFYEPPVEFNPRDFETKQVFYKSKDGTEIPMFITSKKGLKLDGNNPVLLYGYGGFNISLTPAFRISKLFWMEQGGVYAVANIRGGGEYGEKWHKDGTKLKKQNVFDDFIAAAEYLVANNYTNPGKIAVEGGSNGGLLVGAVINQRPDLFKVALPAVGVMDMLRFQKFTIGHAWTEDYGSSDDSVQFQYIYQYSPLHNIAKSAEYPAVLVTTADHDDRVVPAHSFKYIATLQEKRECNELPLLIRIQTNAGHGAGKPVKMQIEEVSDVLSFTLYNMEIKNVK